MTETKTAYGTGAVLPPRCLACDSGSLRPEECSARNDQTRTLVASVLGVFADAGLTYHEAYSMLSEIKAALQVQAERVKLPSS